MCVNYVGECYYLLPMRVVLLSRFVGQLPLEASHVRVISNP